MGKVKEFEAPFALPIRLDTSDGKDYNVLVDKECELILIAEAADRAELDYIVHCVNFVGQMMDQPFSEPVTDEKGLMIIDNKLMIGSSEIPIDMITEPGERYYLPDVRQMVVYTGKAHGVNGNVHVCQLGSGDTYWVDRRRLRRVINLRR